MNRIRVKRLLKKEKQPALFGGKYRFSPYMACGHQCTYCDGRYEKYHVEGDFDRDIVVRENAPELLEQELPRLREHGPVCISSGISDPYQPAEKHLEITRQCAEILSRFDHPTIIHTKSSLVLRDIDYWEKVHRKSAFTLMISLTMTDDGIRDRLEPGASPVEDRLKAIGEFRRRGMNAGILAMPFIPFLTDSTRQIGEFLAALNSVGAQFAIPGLLTLKKGRQKDYFLKELGKMYPHLSMKMSDLYSNEDYYGNPPSGILNSFYRTVEALWSENRMSDLVPHSVYQGQFSLYDEISILLRDMKTLYRKRGINISKLKIASQKYTLWLDKRRTYYARRRNLSYSALEEEIRILALSGELERIINNRKLSEFLCRVINGEVLNYRTLKLK